MLVLPLEPDVVKKLTALVDSTVDQGAGSLTQHLDPTFLHVGLNALNRARLCPGLSEHWADHLRLIRAAEIIEAQYLEEERAWARTYIRELPVEPEAFVDWFVALRENGPGQFDPFFDYLAEEADRSEFEYFVKQEYCGEIGFDDLIALTQVRMPARAKLEMAHNFWDEQGRGVSADVHEHLYVQMAAELGIRDTPDEEFVWETLAVANILTGIAINRRYTWHSLGALSVIELTSPTRATRIAAGLARIGVSDAGCYYFKLHSSLDEDHWAAWLAEVITPLLHEAPALAVPIAEGALMRLCAGARLIAKYRAELGLNGVLASHGNGTFGHAER